MKPIKNKQKYTKQHCSNQHCYFSLQSRDDNDDALYCRYCGCKLIKEVSICFKCDEAFDYSTGSYCKKCGNKLTLQEVTNV